jgi:hypothetical protein
MDAPCSGPGGRRHASPTPGRGLPAGRRAAATPCSSRVMPGKAVVGVAAAGLAAAGRAAVRRDPGSLAARRLRRAVPARTGLAGIPGAPGCGSGPAGFRGSGRGIAFVPAPCRGRGLAAGRGEGGMGARGKGPHPGPKAPAQAGLPVAPVPGRPLRPREAAGGVRQVSGKGPGPAAPRRVAAAHPRPVPPCPAVACPVRAALPAGQGAPAPARLPLKHGEMP